MPRYFLDTSALAKLYRSEAGSALVDRIFSEPASQHLISLLTIVEVESVFAVKVRTGEIDQQAVLIAAALGGRSGSQSAISSRSERRPFSQCQTIAHYARRYRGLTYIRCATTIDCADSQASGTCNSVRCSRSETLPSGRAGRVCGDKPGTAGLNRDLRSTYGTIVVRRFTVAVNRGTWLLVRNHSRLDRPERRQGFREWKSIATNLPPISSRHGSLWHRAALARLRVMLLHPSPAQYRSMPPAVDNSIASAFQCMGLTCRLSFESKGRTAPAAIPLSSSIRFLSRNAGL